MKNNLFLFLIFVFTTLRLSAQNNAPEVDAMNFRDNMLKAVNDMRVKGCTCKNLKMPPVKKLSWNPLLESAAIGHASDMLHNNYFSHVSQNGDEIDKRISATGYNWSYIGENIAWGYSDIEPVMKGWRASVEHCIQLMSPEVTEMGAARYDTFWVMDFGKPMK